MSREDGPHWKGDNKWRQVLVLAWLCPWDGRCAGLGASLEAAHHPRYTGQGCTAMGANCSCWRKHNQSSSCIRVAVNVPALVLLQGGDGVGGHSAHLATPRPAAASIKEGLQTGERVGNGCWERLGTERGMGQVHHRLAAFPCFPQETGAGCAWGLPEPPALQPLLPARIAAKPSTCPSPSLLTVRKGKPQVSFLRNSVSPLLCLSVHLASHAALATKCPCPASGHRGRASQTVRPTVLLTQAAPQPQR